MKHAYRVRAIVSGNTYSGILYSERFTVIASNAIDACDKAISRAKRNTGFKGRWRITELQEHEEPLC